MKLPSTSNIAVLCLWIEGLLISSLDGFLLQLSADCHCFRASVVRIGRRLVLEKMSRNSKFTDNPMLFNTSENDNWPS
jgi:hypothetical protein